MTLRAALGVLLALVLAACAPTPQPTVPPAPTSPAITSPSPPIKPTAQPEPPGTEDLVSATVQVLLVERTEGAELVPYGWGSGTIISPEGLILTNAHVAKPSAPGLSIVEGDPRPAVDPEALVVALLEAQERPPVPTYLASVVAADGYLDAALIRIESTLDGAPVDPAELDLPNIPLGDSDAVSVGDPLTVIGFPGIGGETVSLSSGNVSGFLGDDRIGDRAWIKTDAVVSQGNSGGLAASDRAELVGIPTRANREDVGGFSLVRPINLVKPMVEAALAGMPSLDSRYVVQGSGNESFTFDTWTDSLEGCVPGERLATYPSGTREIIGVFKHSGLVEGIDVLAQWLLDGEILVRTGGQLTDVDQAPCFFANVNHNRGLPDGDYRVEIYVGPTLRPAGSAQTTIGGAPQTGGTATLVGRIVDADSGQGITGAVLFLLQPGVDPGTWLQDPVEAQVATSDQTDRDGNFELVGLKAGEIYPAVALAEGYAPVGGTVGPIPEGRSTLTPDIALLSGG
jgi:serine protease Do